MLVEKFENESTEQLRVYLEELLEVTHPEEVARYGTMLPFGQQKEGKTVHEMIESGSVAPKVRVYLTS